MHDTPDPELLAAFRDGDREAFAVLVARHQGLVRSACLRQAPAGEAEDCIQAVFLVLARRPASASRAPALAAWLLRVSWYVCRRAQRGAKRRRQAEGRAARADGGHGLRPEALDHLDDCLAKLPERQRVAVSMQYLAERPADEVAAALGVNRDNAYQLVSRGLANLRSLLARRGIALSGPALLALLAGEAQAATGEAAETASIAMSLSATPSAHAANLASGAATAMTLAAPSTITLVAASLLLAAGIATAVVSAEPAPIPTAGPVQPAPTALDKALDQEVTLDFQGASLVDAVEVLRRTSKQYFLLDPKVLEQPRSVTLRVANMRLRNVLAHIGRLTGTTCTIIQGHHQEPSGLVDAPTCLIQPAAAALPATIAAGLDTAGADADLRNRLDRRITFDFQDTALTDTIGFLGQVGAVNCVVMPAVASGTSTVTLQVKEMKLQDALNWLCRMTTLSVRYADQALVFDIAQAANAEPGRAPAKPPGF